MSAPASPSLRLRLYVAGSAPNSLLARERAAALLDGLAAELEVIDVFRHPDLAAADGILATPTLVRLAPPPLVRIVGTLGRRELVERTLGIDRS